MKKTNDSYKSYIRSPYKSIKHSTYFDSYDHFFSKYRNQKITFVEIGVLSGGSLFMWRDYFWPKFTENESERRFWSIEIVESMVAFKINNIAFNLTSEPTVNDGVDDLAQDFRYASNSSVEKLYSLATSFSFLKHVPFAKLPAARLNNYLVNRKFGANICFK